MHFSDITLIHEAGFSEHHYLYYEHFVNIIIYYFCHVMSVTINQTTILILF